MSRPRSFDPHTVVDTAMQAFWSGGATGTSIDDLLQATGLSRSSLYNSFGNREGLLQAAVERYLLGYELFRNEGGFTPVEQEIVFLSVSRFNGCTYCMAAHSMIGDKMSKVPADSLAALREGKPLPDAKLQALAIFSTIMVESRGTPSPEQLAAFKSAGYTDRHALEIVLAIAVKTLSNYTNHVFHTPTDPAFQAYAWTATA